MELPAYKPYPYCVKFKKQHTGFVQDLHQWCCHNCLGDFLYPHSGNVFRFEREIDAIVFKMTHDLGFE